MIILHYLNTSRALRTLWLLEELGVSYSISRYERDPTTMLAPQALRTVHPLGKSPIITDGANTVAESGAIAEYLLAQYGQGHLSLPTDPAEALRYSYWMHYSEGSLAPAMILKLLFEMMPKRAPIFLRPIMRLLNGQILKDYIDPQLALHLDFIEAELTRDPWFAGKAFTAADIQMAFPLEALSTMDLLGPNRPNIKRFLDNAHERAAYRRAKSLETASENPG